MNRCVTVYQQVDAIKMMNRDELEEAEHRREANQTTKIFDAHNATTEEWEWFLNTGIPGVEKLPFVRMGKPKKKLNFSLVARRKPISTSTLIRGQDET